MMRRWALWGFLPWLVGCATLISSPQQHVDITSSPPGAQVSVNGEPRGFTPTHLQLQRKQTYTVRLERAGCTPVETEIHKSIAPAFWLNILVFPGAFVDLATGAIYAFDEPVHAALQTCPAVKR